ncbi:MAG: metal-dependent hydrolase [Magnetococcales bacterium]|nr:metal-dependent hydrolase [Magnetococcales bacterium]
MDILTQGVVGAIAAQALSDRMTARRAAMIGFISGLPADADILIRSSSDPLLTLEYHRQFSHALLFIPVGGLLMAILFWGVFRLLASPMRFADLWPLTTAAYATSGLLDACTSYGTQLLWPLSDARIALSIISVFDPLFTTVLLLCLVLGRRRMTPIFARIGFGLALLYLSFGAVQKAQAEQSLKYLAQQRGHQIERHVVKPTLGNLLVWRGIYRHQGQFYIMALRVGPFSEPRYQTGGSLPLFDAAKPLQGLDTQSVLARDIERFSHFSDRYITLRQRTPHPILEDVRYAMFPEALDALWGIEVRLDRPDRHAPFLTFRKADPEAFRRFIDRLGEDWEGWKRVGQP